MIMNAAARALLLKFHVANLGLSLLGHCVISVPLSAMDSSQPPLTALLILEYLSALHIPPFMDSLFLSLRPPNHKATALGLKDQRGIAAYASLSDLGTR